jgi:hypothetical protein
MFAARPIEVLPADRRFVQELHRLGVAERLARQAPATVLKRATENLSTQKIGKPPPAARSLLCGSVRALLFVLAALLIGLRAAGNAAGRWYSREVSSDAQPHPHALTDRRVRNALAAA